MSTISSILPTPPNGFSTQISTATVSSSELTIALDSVSGLPTEGVGQLLKKDADGNLVAGSVEFIHWTNVSGSTITLSDTGDRGITGSDSGAQAYVADDYFEVWVSSYYTPSGIREQINDTNRNEVLKFGATASAVNELTITNAATGAFPTISATGEADTGIDFENSEGEEILKLDAIASAVNEVTVVNAATNNPPQIKATGGDTNIHLALIGKGTGQVVQTINRQGGSATAWDTAGTTDYTANALIQCGTVSVTNQATPATVTFPIAFKTGTEPLVLTTVNSATTTVNSTAAAPNNTTATIYTDDAGNARSVNWIAIGEAPLP